VKYTKPPLKFSSQIAALKQRGLLFDNEEKAKHYLSNISYYRLRAYTYPFQDNTNPKHPFTSAVKFEDIIALYRFDSQLRSLIFNAIETIEIALRTKIIYYYAINTNNSHWYEDKNLFRNETAYFRIMAKLQEEVDRSTEDFIDHYKRKYTEPANPPAWMSLEVISIGLLSQLFQNLKKNDIKKKITNEFGLHKPEFLENWMHVFTNIRNLCAHHSRIWNRRLVNTPVIPRNTIYPFVSEKFHTNKLYATLCCIQYIYNVISPGSSFSKNLQTLIDSCRIVQLKEMGFPTNWSNEKLWK
jgi:abortive infection bacteriophage resistance protein